MNNANELIRQLCTDFLGEYETGTDRKIMADKYKLLGTLMGTVVRGSEAGDEFCSFQMESMYHSIRRVRKTVFNVESSSKPPVDASASS